MEKKPTIYDIAKALNVTTSTVSRALKNSSLISEDTRKKVWEYAKKINYRPNKIASSLSSGKSNIVGVIIPSALVQFFSAVINSLEQILQQKGYTALLYQTNESYKSEVNGIKTLLEAQVDGIIISPSLETYDFSHINKAHHEGIPVIQFDRVDDKIDLPSVSIDDEKAGYIATKHLIESGYERISYISTDSKIQIFKQRFEGYKRALSEYGYLYREGLVVLGEMSIKGGMEGARKIMESKHRPDAFIGMDDFTALGIIKELTKMNIIPPQIPVVGFANQTFSEYITPSLSTIDQQAENMGKECANLFLKIRDKKSDSDDKIEKIVLDPILIKRESS
ncbi:LacI family DNA-binding transcriptional regulator [Elizabethkingia miricola]|uniref:LacI family DNA-binding transcriptional regulator n=1 Tax=Elizabethkingia miricola TaxID=172045 RepID=A0ABD5B688_ELIMR|nr:LacI family DNA-binding transcriptional regulator [Elizabethkingia miricola]MDQ8749245.1 LacI family DNA-binding transcriptional regulator [Elizabethkingia miricola]OPB91999.1 LacI family transcriptional regulator [Elizabethkingia miricola]